MAYVSDSGKRNKKKGKFKDKKKNPYKVGGAQRSMNISLENKESSSAKSIKKSKKKKSKKSK